MNHMKLSRFIIGLAVTIFLLGSLTASSVSAQTTNANSAQGIQVSPTLYELNAERGKTYSIELTVMNVTLTDLLYTVSVDDFNSSDETGSPHIILNSELPETASVMTWVSTIPDFILKSRESKKIDAQITIPGNAEPGGHYGVIRFSGSAPEIESTGVGLSASAGVLILIRVDGTISETASLVSFYSANGDKQSSFFENGPINLVARIKNDGNVHVKPSGDIEIRDIFGNLTATFPVNRQEPKSNVLPNSIRRFEVSLNKSWMVGPYTANLTLGYGTTGQAITSTINFWVIPYRIILVGLMALATLIFILRRLLKVYNRRIIEKSKNENIDKNKKRDKEKH